MCSLILIALNTFLATPGCVAADGAATLAAQRWGAFAFQESGYNAVIPIHEEYPNRVVAGVIAHGPDAYLGFTWFADSYTLVLEDTRL
jgi:hypothetical protein